MVVGPVDRPVRHLVLLETVWYKSVNQGMAAIVHTSSRKWLSGSVKQRGRCKVMATQSINRFVLRCLFSTHALFTIVMRDCLEQ